MKFWCKSLNQCGPFTLELCQYVINYLQHKGQSMCPNCVDFITRVHLYGPQRYKKFVFNITFGYLRPFLGLNVGMRSKK